MSDRPDPDVLVHHDPALAYPAEPPYHPGEVYPELAAAGLDDAGPPNPVYAAVRRVLGELGLDRARLGTPAWNPLGDLARPGATIVLKPNLVLHELGPLVGARALCTDGSIVRAVADYAALAAGERGRVRIVDVPLQGADLDRLRRQLGLDEAIAHLGRRGRDVAILDLREERAVLSEDGTQILGREPLPGDPEGYTVVDLGPASFLDELARAGARFGVTDYVEDETNRHHAPGRHEYRLANTVLRADAVIGLPKLKTHQKAGLTAAMKNLVGVNGSKAYLAHHRPGPPARGGDEYPIDSWFHLLFREARRALNERAPHALWRRARAAGLLLRRILATARAGAGADGDGRAAAAEASPYLVGAGGWYGNETIWRTIYDINRAFLEHAPGAGGRPPGRRVTDGPRFPRRASYLVLVDGVVAGEGNGPLQPEPRRAGLLVAGRDPLLVDRACARLMGFDERRVPFLREWRRLAALGLTAADGALEERAVATSEAAARCLRGAGPPPAGPFRPPPGWIGHVELASGAAPGPASGPAPSPGRAGVREAGR